MGHVVKRRIWVSNYENFASRLWQTVDWLRVEVLANVDSTNTAVELQESFELSHDAQIGIECRFQIGEYADL